MKCRVPNCRKKSKGPRFHFMCAEHMKLPVKMQKDYQARYNRRNGKLIVAETVETTSPFNGEKVLTEGLERKKPKHRKGRYGTDEALVDLDDMIKQMPAITLNVEHEDRVLALVKDLKKLGVPVTVSLALTLPRR